MVKIEKNGKIEREVSRKKFKMKKKGIRNKKDQRKVKLKKEEGIQRKRFIERKNTGKKVLTKNYGMRKKDEID